MFCSITFFLMHVYDLETLITWNCFHLSDWLMLSRDVSKGYETLFRRKIIRKTIFKKKLVVSFRLIFIHNKLLQTIF